MSPGYLIKPKYLTNYPKTKIQINKNTQKRLNGELGS